MSKAAKKALTDLIGKDAFKAMDKKEKKKLLDEIGKDIAKAKLKALVKEPGDNPLRKALKQIFDSGKDVFTTPVQQGEKIAAAAIESKDTEVLKVLLDEKLFDLREKTSKGKALVDLAAEEVSKTDKPKSTDKKTVADELKQELTLKNSRNASLTLNEIFWYAVENNDRETVKKLARNDAVALNIRTPRNDRIIEALLRNNNFEMVQILLINGRQFTPENLSTAVQYKKIEVVKILVQSPPIINYLRDPNNNYDAFGKLQAYYDDLKQQELKRAELEKKEAELKETDRKEAERKEAEHKAEETKAEERKETERREYVERKKEKDDDLDLAESISIITLAVNLGMLGMVKILHEAGAEIIEEDMQSAIEKGFADIVQYFCEQDKEGNLNRTTALNNASESGHIHVAQALVKHGNIDFHDESATYVQNAARKNHFEMFDFLVKAGADFSKAGDLHLKDEHGQTAANSEVRDPRIINLLDHLNKYKEKLKDITSKPEDQPDQMQKLIKDMENNGYQSYIRSVVNSVAKELPNVEQKDALISKANALIPKENSEEKHRGKEADLDKEKDANKEAKSAQKNSDAKPSPKVSAPIAVSVLGQVAGRSVSH